MIDSVIAELDCTDSVCKRAQWEAFDFTLLGDGQVEVRNDSYPNEEVPDHTYVVVVEDGSPVRCGCPAAEHFEGACKHQVAVGIRAPLIAAVVESEGTQVAADGGALSKEASTVAETCLNDDPHCKGPDADDLPCFECYVMPESR